MSTAFRNNLEKNDRVFDTVSRRQGKVARTPRDERARMVSITFDGTSTPRYVDVMQLRLMPDGRTPEEAPPVDGTPPSEETGTDPGPALARAAPEPDALGALRTELHQNNEEMTEMNARFKLLRERNERIERAISALTQPA